MYFQVSKYTFILYFYRVKGWDYQLLFDWGSLLSVGSWNYGGIHILYFFGTVCGPDKLGIKPLKIMGIIKMLQIIQGNLGTL